MHGVHLFNNELNSNFDDEKLTQNEYKILYLRVLLMFIMFLKSLENLK